MFKIATLTRFVIIPISLVKLVINFPECLLSINFVSALIRDLNISTCISLLTLSETLIIKSFARYNELPFAKNAKIINPGIRNIIF